MILVQMRMTILNRKNKKVKQSKDK